MKVFINMHTQRGILGYKSCNVCNLLTKTLWSISPSQLRKRKTDVKQSGLLVRLRKVSISLGFTVNCWIYFRTFKAHVQLKWCNAGKVILIGFISLYPHNETHLNYNVYLQTCDIYFAKASRYKQKCISDSIIDSSVLFFLPLNQEWKTFSLNHKVAGNPSHFVRQHLYWPCNNVCDFRPLMCLFRNEDVFWSPTANVIVRWNRR